MFVSASGLTASVLDPAGAIVRSMAFPAPRYAAAVARAAYGVGPTGFSGFDRHQRLYLPGSAAVLPYTRPTPSNRTSIMLSADSAPLLRLDFATRRVDTAGFYRVPASKTVLESDDNGRVMARPEMTPIVTLDEWVVLASGEVAILRGQDYRLDVIDSNGTLRRGAKVSFPWQRLDDDAKIAVLDSMKHAVQSEMDGSRGGGIGSATATATHAASSNVHTDSATAKPTGEVDPLLNFASVDRIGDYRAPFLRGALLPDLDGNVWVRTTIAGRPGWGSVYDIIAADGRLVDRVQIAAGRRVVGFGPAGAVILASGDAGQSEWLERTRWHAPLHQ
jgi:hypothetical protein